MDIHQYEIRFQRIYLIDSIFPILRRSHDFDIRCQAKDNAQTFPNNFLIFSYQYPDFFHIFSSLRLFNKTYNGNRICTHLLDRLETIYFVGIVHIISVPLSACECTYNLPFRFATRSDMAFKPNPSTSLPAPFPLSTILI
ncbi:hypothetical protein D3C73_1092540 [compost metagenome]